jgi:hypothetical protein
MVALFSSFFLTQIDDKEAMKKGGCDIDVINNLGSRKAEKVDLYNPVKKSETLENEETFKLE